MLFSDIPVAYGELSTPLLLTGSCCPSFVPKVKSNKLFIVSDTVSLYSLGIPTGDSWSLAISVATLRASAITNVASYASFTLASSSEKSLKVVSRELANSPPINIDTAAFTLLVALE